MERKVIGKKGENLAAKFLQQSGHHILARNYRYRRGEIDIIASKENLILFIEVKVRSSVYFGHPEEAVSEAQAERIATVAEAFLEATGRESQPIRFDIIAISHLRGHYEIEHFEDAFC